MAGSGADFLTFYLSPGDDHPNRLAQLAGAWLREQPGDGLVLLHAKKMIDNNNFLREGTRGLAVESPNTIARSGWRGGPVLAAWPSEQVLEAIAGSLGYKITTLCILKSEVARDDLESWLAGRGAVNLLSGKGLSGDSVDPGLDPVVIEAMVDLAKQVNHNNALDQDFEKSLAVRTLQLLDGEGYRWSTGQLCGWAMSHGFTGAEVKNLRDISDKVLAGRRFRLRETVGPSPDALARWQRAAIGG